VSQPNTSGADSLNVVANVAGKDLYNATWSLSTGQQQLLSWNPQFFTQSATIPTAVPGVDVTITAALNGSASIYYNASMQGSQATLTVDPKAALTASVAGGVAFFCVPFIGCAVSAQIGVQANILQADAPSSAGLVVSPSGVGWSVNSDVMLSTGAGNATYLVDAFGQQVFGGTIFSWPAAASVTYPIEHDQGCFGSFSGPVCGNGMCEAGEYNYNCPSDCPPPPPPPPPPPACRAGYRDCGDGFCVKYPAVCP
jgi:hypothetical protein